jgi:hypothetical protein
LTLDEEKYYDHYFNTFSTEGWKQFKDEIQEIYDSYRIEDIKDESQLARVKGERAMLFKMLRFEGGIRGAYDLIKEREASTNV